MFQRDVQVRSLATCTEHPVHPYRFLTGNLRGAKDDLIESAQLNPSLTQSLVKLASVYMEESDPIAAFTSFDKAIEINPEDPDIYYHRGQGSSLFSISHGWN